ncbi:MAG: hypothetical protein KC978_23915, partial [Candidatus Omnitrophica bacterium]|nr:hypothetical protein [Candidatus Omnitrophota bacterium]
EEGQGQTLNDLTANKNDGVLGNSESEDLSDPVWVDEGAPVYSGPLGKPIVQIQPTHPGTLDDLFAVILNEAEIVGASTSINYDWYRDGELAQSGNESSFSAENTSRGQTISCEVLLSEGELESDAGEDSVVIRNTQPSPPVYHILPEDPMPNDPLAVIFDQASVDPDGDPVVYVFEWFESSDGENWTRRPEISGTLPPPLYVSGEPEISGLYTQMGEYWRVEVTAWDGILEAKRWQSTQIEAANAKQVFGPIRNQVRVSTSLNGDLSIGPDDMLFLLGLWHKTKGELSDSMSLKFFEPSMPDDSKVGKEHLMRIGLEGWYYQGD